MKCKIKMFNHPKKINKYLGENSEIKLDDSIYSIVYARKVYTKNKKRKKLLV